MHEMKRLLAPLGLVLGLVLIMSSTWTGDPEKFRAGHLELHTVASSAGTATSAYAQLRWVDADADNTLDSGDGLYFLQGSTPYGPVLLSGGAGSVTGLTSPRIPFASSATALTDDAGLSWTNATNTLNLGEVGSGGTGDIIITGNTSGTFTLSAAAAAGTGVMTAPKVVFDMSSLALPGSTLPLTITSGGVIGTGAVVAGGIVIGDPVSGGSNYRYLYSDGSNNLAQNAALTAGLLPRIGTNGLLADSLWSVNSSTGQIAYSDNQAATILSVVNANTGAVGAATFSESGASGVNWGSYSNVSSVTGGSAGVQGRALGVTGATYGGQFQNESTTAGAVAAAGFANGTSGVTYGGYFTNASVTAGAMACNGTATGASGAIYGGYFSIPNTADNNAYSMYALQHSFLGTYFDCSTGSAPSSPQAGVVRFYEMTDVPYWKTSGGTVNKFASDVNSLAFTNKTTTWAAGGSGGAPEVFTSGTLATTPAAGSVEYEGSNFYGTIDTTSSRGCIPVEQYFHLTGDITGISTIANFFGATSNINLVASAYYEIDIDAWYQCASAGTVTWTLTNSAAPTSQNIYYTESPVIGLTAPPGAATQLVGEAQGDATAAYAFTTGTLTNGSKTHSHFHITLKNGSGTTLLLQVTKNVTGTVVPLTGSFWRCRRVPAANVGAFAS